MEPITFGDLRKYCSHLDRVSICIHETGQYDNYRLIVNVPSTYDTYYLYGFGMFESEFVDDGFEGWDRSGSAFPSSTSRKAGRWSFQPCIEIMLSKTPRTDL
ncbi:MAG TPA: hypothetical protein DC024_03350 [Clostridiales bacterium]|jgi:hypothetical protein|uniref:hypothetical protein n=1 Tax=Muricomes intestini TaxID=1796634 RepID=UPI000E9BFB58|nr:hypothetical protein [Clostridiales bacterium]HBI72865.1 hypothetical protein [Lachnospiraceae bacterium]